MAVEVNEQTFEQEVLKSDIPVLVDFWATWCGPCQMMGPVVEKLYEEQAGKVKVCKVNVDDNTELAEKYGVMSIPNFVLFKNGKVAGQHIGASSKEALEKFIQS